MITVGLVKSPFGPDISSRKTLFKGKTPFGSNKTEILPLGKQVTPVGNEMISMDGVVLAIAFGLPENKKPKSNEASKKTGFNLNCEKNELELKCFINDKSITIFFNTNNKP